MKIVRISYYIIDYTHFMSFVEFPLQEENSSFGEIDKKNTVAYIF